MESRSRTRTAKAPSVNDDLKLITGISRMSESRLQQAGILTHAHLGSLDPEEIAEIVELPAAKIAAQDWIGQARELAAAKKHLSKPSGELRNTGFVVELFVDADKNLVTTQVLHVDSNEGESWPGWNTEQMLRFFAEHACVELKGEEAPLMSPEDTLSAQPASQALKPQAKAEEVETAELTLDAIAIVPEGTEIPSRSISPNQPFDVNLSVSVTGSLNTRGLAYTAYVHARQAGGKRVALAEARGEFRRVGDKIQIKVPGGKLAQGFYSISSYLMVSRPDQQPYPELGAYSLASGKLVVSDA